MHIDTPKTVEKTLSLHLWDGPNGWEDAGCDLKQKNIYSDHRLNIYKQMGPHERRLVFETPEYTLYVAKGNHLDLVNPENQKPVVYRSLSMETTNGETTVYRSMMDETGFRDIQGDRQFLFRFLKKVPDNYFSLVVDETAQHVSTCWMRAHCQRVRSHRPLIDKEKS